jgi:hypothetical protein
MVSSGNARLAGGPGLQKTRTKPDRLIVFRRLGLNHFPPPGLAPRDVQFAASRLGQNANVAQIWGQTGLTQFLGNEIDELPSVAEFPICNQV